MLECAHCLGIDLVSVCGGVGNCGHCKVQVFSGQVSEPTSAEEAVLTPHELKQGFRLACQTYPLSDIKLSVPSESLTALQRTQVEGLEVSVELDPPVVGLDAHLTPPTLETPCADDQSIWTALSEQRSVESGIIDLPVQQFLSRQLRSTDWHVRVALRGSEIVAVGPPPSRWLGLAVDIGTTKIAGYLLDMETGRTLALKGLMNPQISYGEDIITRIVAASRAEETSKHLQELLIDALNQLAVDLCTQIDADPMDIVEAVVVGNTVIHHLFLRLPVGQLGCAPYVPAVCSALDIKARDIGLHIAPGAYVHLLPIIAGYVGADHVAVLLATKIADADGVVLVLDIGTNTEICLNNHGKMTSVSCASGPAFEGAHIKFGMRAAPGAIEHVRLNGERVEYQVIDAAVPVGICGSGLLDVVAQLRLNDVLDRHGRMGDHPRVRTRNDTREFVLISEDEREGLDAITISQKDVRELQLAKAAIRSGIQALVDAHGLTENEIEQVIVAGAFGTFIDVASAVTIGMLPDLPLERFKQVGNAAGTGARLALISCGQRAEAKRIAQLDGYIELARVPGFDHMFAGAIFLD